MTAWEKWARNSRAGKNESRIRSDKNRLSTAKNNILKLITSYLYKETKAEVKSKVASEGASKTFSTLKGKKKK